jgi:hypothetical protein
MLIFVEQSSLFTGLPRIIGGRDLVVHDCLTAVQQEWFERTAQVSLNERFERTTQVSLNEWFERTTQVSLNEWFERTTQVNLNACEV